MDKIISISNRWLKVDIQLPEDAGCRFDSACKVRQVTLNGKHTFCQPEQVRPERRSSGGWGLCSEFDWEQVAVETPPGSQFSKPGVGLLTQVPEGGPFDKWKPYAIQRFQKNWEVRKAGITFWEKPQLCNGNALSIRKDLSLYGNTITITTTLLNEGWKPADLLEYQHNFVSIDGLPSGPGHRLEVPCDTELWKLENAFHDRREPDRSKRAAPAALVNNGIAQWVSDMEMKTFMKTASKEVLAPNAPYTWRLSHIDSNASITEVSHFAPEKIVLWGNEHCICPEIFVQIFVEPGEVQTISRTWIFEDDITRDYFR